MSCCGLFLSYLCISDFLLQTLACLSNKVLHYRFNMFFSLNIYTLPPKSFLYFPVWIVSNIARLGVKEIFKEGNNGRFLLPDSRWATSFRHVSRKKTNKKKLASIYIQNKVDKTLKSKTNIKYKEGKMENIMEAFCRRWKDGGG